MTLSDSIILTLPNSTTILVENGGDLGRKLGKNGVTCLNGKKVSTSTKYKVP